MKQTNLFILFILLFVTHNLFAQKVRKVARSPINKKVIVTTTNGEKYIGILNRKSDTELALLTETDTIFIPQSLLKELSVVTDSLLSSQNNKLANAYYGLMPSAVAQEKGTISYRNVMVLGNNFSFTPQKGLTIHAGMPMPPIFALGREDLSEVMNLVPIWYGIKYNLNTTDKGLNLAVGFNGCQTPFVDDDFDVVKVNYLNMTATYLAEQGSFTINTGAGRDRSFSESYSSYYFGMSGTIRLNDRSSKHFLVGEVVRSNFIQDEPLSTFLMAYRYKSKKKFVADFGLVVLNDIYGDINPYPYFSWSKFF